MKADIHFTYVAYVLNIIMKILYFVRFCILYNITYILCILCSQIFHKYVTIRNLYIN